MTTQEYQKLAARTCIPKQDMHLSPEQVDLLHCCQGLCTEAGEAMDALKRHFMYKNHLDSVNLREELGDILWYIGMICERMGWDMSTIMERNIQKLRVRFPDKFTENSALNRDLETERKVLEG